MKEFLTDIFIATIGTIWALVALAAVLGWFLLLTLGSMVILVGAQSVWWALANVLFCIVVWQVAFHSKVQRYWWPF